MKRETQSSTVYRLGAVTLAVLGASAAFPAAAQWSPIATPHGYIGANVGSGRTDFNISPSFTVPAASVSRTSEDDRDTAWKLYGGYQFSRNLAIEGGYYNLGRNTYTYGT